MLLRDHSLDGLVDAPKDCVPLNLTVYGPSSILRGPRSFPGSSPAPIISGTVSLASPGTTATATSTKRVALYGGCRGELKPVVDRCPVPRLRSSGGLVVLFRERRLAEFREELIEAI
jgi:hypothetical protein